MSDTPPEPLRSRIDPIVLTSPTVVAPAPLTKDQLAEIERAKIRGKKIRRATSVAYSDAWISALFAGTGILMGCFGIDNLIVGLAMGLVAYNSFRGAAGLKRFDLTAPGRLAINQLMLASFLTLYFAYQLWAISTGRLSLAGMLAGSGDMKDLGNAGVSIQAIQDLVTKVMYWAYMALIAATLITQGLTALYYKSRRKLLEDYLQQTPAWVIQLQAVKA